MKSFSYLVFTIIMAATIVAQAQSETSAIKMIKLDNINVTEPMIAVNPTDLNNFIAVYSNWHNTLSRKPASSRTTDGGVTWSSTEVPANLLLFTDQADPTVAFDADGNAHYCYLDLGFRNNIMVANSTDKGTTWTSVSAAYNWQNPLIGYPIPDKPWITVDRTTGQYRNTLYVVWTAMYNYGTPQAIYKIYLSYKRGGQNNFSTPIPISLPAQYPLAVQAAFPVVGTDGTLYVFWSLENANPGYNSQIKMSKSIDGGENWTGEQSIKTLASPEGLILDGTFQKAHGWPYVALNSVDGSLNLIYGDGFNILFSRSTDNGASWSISSQMGLKPSGISEVWNPNITCDSNGKLAIVYYASSSNLPDNTRIYVANGYATDAEFTIRSEGAVLFNPNTWKYTDYIGIAGNDYTYWGVWPAQATNNRTQIMGRYRLVSVVAENLDQSYNQLNNTIKMDNNVHNSPYTTPNLTPGESHSFEIVSNQIIRNGNTYEFNHWEDENGSLLGTTSQIMHNIEAHRYRAIFSYVPPPPPVPCTVYVKNEFKDPDETISNGGTVNIDYLNYYNTEFLPGKQVIKIFNEGSQHRLEAKEQIFPEEPIYFRGFNSYINLGGGWYKDGIVITGGNYSIINPLISSGTYTAKYRNRYNIDVVAYAQELNNTVSLAAPQYVWQFENQLISAPLNKTFGNLTGNFLAWLDWEYSNSRYVSPSDNTTYTALYKINNKTNNPSAIRNNNEQHIIRSNSGHLHKVYTSMYHVWYERSIDDGVTWTIANEGKPAGVGSSVSIDYYTSASEGESAADDNIVIVFQSDTKIIAQYYVNGILQFENIIYDGFTQNGLNPIVSCTDWGGRLLVIYNLGGYLFYDFGQTVVSDQVFNWYIQDEYVRSIQTEPNQYAREPTIACKKGDNKFQLAWNENWTSIQYIDFKMNDLANNVSIQNRSTISTGCGYPVVYYPDIYVKNSDGNPSVTWVGSPYYGSTSTKVIYKSGSFVNDILSWGSFTQLGSNNSSPVISYADDNSLCIGWSKLATPQLQIYRPKYISTLTTSGQYIQLTGGPNYINMYALTMQNSTVPYSFSTTNVSSISKIKEIPLSSGRGNVIISDTSEIYNYFGDITLDGDPISFPVLDDTIEVNNLSDVNRYMSTELFTVNNNSSLNFTFGFEFIDTAAVMQLLMGGNSVHYKLLLLNDDNELVAEIFSKTLDVNSIVQNGFESYSLSLSGFAGDLKIGLEVTTTINGYYNLIQLLNDSNCLPKVNNVVINLKDLAVSEYTLSQNFPNPFNPATTMNYQLPQTGFVTLKVYDILGKEVTTLVNEQKAQGRYSVNFDASRLSSGVYIYQIRVNDYVSSKKMLLLK